MPRRWIAAAAVPIALALAPAASTEPILDPLRPTFPAFQGATATPDPVTYTRAPRNRFMAPNPRSNIHNDTWMTDAYRRAGPVGRSPEAFSSAMRPALCGSLTFHSRGYIVSVCPSLVAPPQLRVIDPVTLELLATYDMPSAPDPPGTKAYQNFAGGGYFFLDGRDRVWSATKTSHLFVLKVSPDGRGITLVRDYDLTGVLEDDERITSALPDFRGRIWFVSKKNAKVGILNPRTRRVRGRRLGHHAHDHARRLRRDHRQRRPDERGRVPKGRAAEARAAARGLRRARVRPGRERHRELAHDQPPLAVRGEQLRLPGPVRAEHGRDHHAGVRARGREAARPWLPQGLDQHDRAGADRRAEAVHGNRPDLHLHARPGGRSARPRPPALVLDCDQRAHRRHGIQGLCGQRPGLQQQLRGPGNRRDRHGLPRRHRRDGRAARPLRGG